MKQNPIDDWVRARAWMRREGVDPDSPNALETITKKLTMKIGQLQRAAPPTPPSAEPPRSY